MPKYATPKQYKAPLKKRADIAAFLASHKGRHTQDGYCRFVWDVKLYGICLEFEHLFETFRGSGYGDAEMLVRPEVQEIYRQIYASNIDWAEDEGIAQAWQELNDSDTYTHLWDGTDCQAKFRSYGRSGGHVGLQKFLRYDLTRECDNYGCVLVWSEMDYQDLRLLYRFIVMLDHDLTRDRACAAVESHAADRLFYGREEEVERRLAARWPKQVVPALVLGGVRRIRL